MIKNLKVSFQLFLSLGLVLQVACMPRSKTTSGVAQGVPEETYCSTISPVTNGVTLSGIGQYEYFKPVYQSPSGPFGLTEDVGNVPFVKPIRHAEVRIKNSAGTIIQCGETDDLGQFNVSVPAPIASESYVVEINSRALNSYVQASILDKSTSKKYYTIAATTTVTPTDTLINLPTLVAPARVSNNSTFKNIEGGAFHILDEILNVNNYLRSNTSLAECTICQAFTVAPKVSVYWIKGFNPASYLGETSPLSFFDSSSSIDTTPSLYILGGTNGDVDNSDTDHFDDSVIIHEYGHFLEKNYWKTNSPGGVHNGNMIIDPRLAFSEGFANFLPSAVQNSTTYIDTIGSPDGTPQVGVFMNLETEPTTAGTGRDKIIVTNTIGEGIYREVSISRSLFDYIDSIQDTTYSSAGTANAVTETSNFSFAFIWLALTNSSFGLMAPNHHFISMGNFNQSLYAGIDAVYPSDTTKVSDLDSARIGEFQTNNLSEYGQPLVRSSSSCVKTISPVNSRLISIAPPAPDESYYYHDLFSSSDFYRIDHPGGPLNIQMAYTPSNSAAPPDLDLYLYKETHSISESADLAGVSDKSRVDEIPTAGNESISVNIPAGTYMLLVNVATLSNYSGSSASYTLISSGEYLCNAP